MLLRTATQVLHITVCEPMQEHGLCRTRTTSRATCQAGVRYTVVVTSSVVVVNSDAGASAPLAASAMSAAVPSLGSVSTESGAALKDNKASSP